jgi:hydroxypyruvate isomerase
MELSGCLESLFLREHQTVDARIRACAAAGLQSVEFWQWRDKDLDKIERALADTGVALTQFSTEPRSPIVDPATHRDFLAGVRDSAAAAKRLKAHGLCVLVDDRGVGAPTSEPRAASRAAQHAAIITALKQAGPIAEDAGIVLLVEPLNSELDHKGYFLDRTPEGLDIIEEVGHPAVRLLYDMYHSKMMGEDFAEVLAGRGSLVGHVHVADVPGRHEPGKGTVDWRAGMAALAAEGYRGRVGLEFWPSNGTVDALKRTRMALSGEAANP